MIGARTTAVLIAILFAGCLGAIGSDSPFGSDDDPDALVSACPSEVENDDGPSDPDSDVLGWEDGVWANESIDVDQSDGLDCRELALTRARTMARVEAIRDLEFERTVPTRVISRETFRERATSGEVPSEPTVQDALYEALFLVDERTNAETVRRQNRGTSVGAYYSSAQNAIVIITPDPDRVQISSALLAHELVHALQNQHFDRAQVEPTLDAGKARLGLTEGDANYVQYQYRQRCGEAWDRCLVPDPRPAQARPQARGLTNRGLHLITFQPYSDGPAFVETLREAGGWSAVGDAYGSLPASTEQTIHADRYPDDSPTAVTVSDTSTEAWTPLTRNGERVTETAGEVGLFAMFAYPFYHSNGSVEIISRDAFQNRDADGNPDRFDPYNYSHPYSEGWDGDRLVAYRNGDETAYVWKLAFDSETDAREFLTGYRRILEYRGAEPEADRRNVWTIDEDESFGDAFAIRQSGSTVVVVNAPTVEDLGDVRSGLGS